MTASEINTFEATYTDDLMKAELDRADAAAIASKTARIRQAALEAAAKKKSLVKGGGMSEERAKAMAAAHGRFHSPLEPNAPAQEPRVDGFKSMADLLGSANASPAPAAPAVMPPATSSAQRSRPQLPQISRHRRRRAPTQSPSRPGKRHEKGRQYHDEQRRVTRMRGRNPEAEHRVSALRLHLRRRPYRFDA